MTKYLKMDLRSHQKEGAGFLIKNKNGVLNHTTGSGKSYTSLAAVAWALENLDNVFVILFGTASSFVSITNEIKKNTTLKYEILERHDPISLEADVILIKYSFVAKRYDYIVDVIKSMKAEGRTVIAVLDEVHYIKTRFDPKAFDRKCQKRIAEGKKEPLPNIRFYFDLLRKLFDYTWGLTATTIFRNLDDLHSIIYFISGGQFLDYWEFRDYFYNYRMKKIRVRGGRSRRIPEVYGYKNMDVLLEWIRKFIHIYDSGNNVIFKEHKVSMHDIMYEKYLQIAKGIVKERVEGGDKARLAFSSRLIELQKLLDGSPVKLLKLKEMIKEHIDSGVIIYVSYYETLDFLTSHMEGYEWKEITGRVNKVEDRREIVDWFGPGKILFITGAGGQSLNLQKTNHLVMYDIPFGVGYVLQVLGRVSREFSQFNEFFIHFVMVERTIDVYKKELAFLDMNLIKYLFSNDPKAYMMEKEENNFAFYRGILRKMKEDLLWKRGSKFND